MRRSAVHGRPESASQAFADDVAYYLALSPRQLPSQYLYDELGSALFEAICALPWYRITRTEQRMLRAHGASVARRMAPLSRLVELGPGSGAKLVTLLAAAPTEDLTVHLVDVSAAALATAARAVAEATACTVVAHQSTYEAGLAAIRRHAAGEGRTLVLFLGSNIGNFDPPGADALLVGIRGAMRRGDALLLGTDLVKPERELLLAYDDPLGVTAAFNRNLLVRANRELGADFAVEQFAHRAAWNSEQSRVEMHLVSLCRQRVSVPAARLDIVLEAGESIWTESSYKYRADDVSTMLDRSGFGVVRQWVEDGFALTLAEAG